MKASGPVAFFVEMFFENGFNFFNRYRAVHNYYFVCVTFVKMYFLKVICQFHLSCLMYGIKLHIFVIILLICIEFVAICPLTNIYTCILPLYFLISLIMGLSILLVFSKNQLWLCKFYCLFSISLIFLFTFIGFLCPYFSSFLR